MDAVLSKVLEKHGLSEQVQRMEVLDLWPEVAGEQLARVTRVRGVEDAVLFIEVRNSAWLMELSMMTGDFLARVNERLGNVSLERIVFVQAETE